MWWRDFIATAAARHPSPFPDATLPIHATWYSGTLRCPLGEIKNYVHQGYSSEYQRDLLIEIKDGMFVSEREREWSEESGEPLKHEEGHTASLCPSFYRAEIVQNPGVWDRFIARLRSVVIGWLQPA